MPTSLLHLPSEILDAILSLIDSHDHILAFALANRACAAFAIPRHTEYRILRIRHSRPELWAHLAQRADLASFITHVHISDRYTCLQPDRIPRALVDPSIPHELINPHLLEAVRVQNMCKAIGNMKSLRSFVWEFNMKPPEKPTLSPEHEDAILWALRRKQTLEHLALIGPFGSHAPSLNLDAESQQYPLWRFANIKYLSLLGDSWVKPAIAPHVFRLLLNMSHIEHLEIPLEFVFLHHCMFSALRNLKLPLLTGASATIDLTRSQFIERHSTLERLWWFPLGLPSLNSDALPNLRSLTTTRPVVECLVSVAPPPPTPSSLSFAAFQSLPPITEDPRETNTASPSPSGSIRRPIECLDVRSLDARSLVEFHRHFMDPTALRKLKLHTFHDVVDVCQVGDTFPGVTWLWLPTIHLPSGSAHPKQVEMDDLYKIVSHFPRLETLRGHVIWTAAGYKNEKVHLAIMNLAQMLPNLKELDHSGFDQRKQAFRRVVVRRDITIQRTIKHHTITTRAEKDLPEDCDCNAEEQEELEVEHITYTVVKPRSRDAWDIFEGTFD